MDDSDDVNAVADVDDNDEGDNELRMKKTMARILDGWLSSNPRFI